MSQVTDKIDLSASDQSYVISQTKVMRRYSALFRALQDEEEEEPQEVDGLSPEYEAFCRSVLGIHDDDHKYVVRRQFAHGGMGTLYYVTDRDFRRNCVMKVILPNMRENDMVVRSFVREARITGQLEHPNIIPVHDLGYHREFGLFFTMKLIEGRSLNDILNNIEGGDPDDCARYDLWELLTIFRRVCDAVAFAHSRGIIHRDIKPRNIMVGAYGAVLLMDWGLAKSFRNRPEDHPDDTEGDRDDGEATEAGDFKVIKGSPGYMSPEQAAGQSARLDPRSDIFLLGATLYNILTFFPPYIGENLAAVLNQARRCDYEPLDPSALGGLHVPAEICRIVNKCMARRPADRYPCVDALIADLDDVIHGRMQLEKRTFRKGQLLIREGEAGHECYIIESGEVEVFKTRDGQDFPLGVCGPEEIVGEMAVITHEPRSASVRALRRTRVLVLSEESFRGNLKKLPPWLEKTIVTLAKRLYLTDSKLTGTSHG